MVTISLHVSLQGGISSKSDAGMTETPRQSTTSAPFFTLESAQVPATIGP